MQSMLASDVQNALTHGQSKLDKIRQMKNAEEAERLWKRKFETRERQLAVLDAFPVFVRRFIKFSYSPDRPDNAPIGARYEEVSIEIPELAPIRVELSMQNDGKWAVGNGAQHYIVPSFYGNPQIGADWDYHHGTANISDLELALAYAYERGLEFKKLDEEFKSRKVTYEDIDE